MKDITRKRLRVEGALLAAFVIFALTFAADIFTPVIFTIWFLYLFPVFFIFFIRQSHILFLPLIGTALIIFNYFHSPPAGILMFAAINRTLAIGLYWLIAVAVIRKNKAENELRQTAEHLRLALEAGNEGTFDYEPAAGRYFLDSRSRAIFGLSEGKPITYEEFFLLVLPEDRQYIDKAVRKAFSPSSSGQYEAEFRIKLPNGDICWVSARGQAYFAYDGGRRSVTRFIGTNVDITERKRTEEALRVTEQRYRNLFHSMDEGFASCEMIYDESGMGVDFRYLEVNHSFAELLDLPFERMTGSTVRQLIPDIDPVWIETYDRVVKTGHSERFESRIRRGRYFDVHVWRTGIRRFAVVFNDITDRKRVEEILKRDRDTLDRLVTDRSSRLLEAQKELDRSRRLSDIGTLAATVAHELRNPLAFIKLAGSNIKRKADNPEIQRKADTIGEKVDDGNKIIDNLLFYARLKPPHPENLNLYELLREELDMVKARYSLRGIDMRLLAEDVKGLIIEADPGQLKELLGNVLNNAIEAIPGDKKGEIKVFAARDDGFVEVCVRDNGSGISSENRERIFQPFFSTKKQGTGLGLSVVKQIVDMHKGSVRMESEIGKMTEVILRLPIEQK